MSAAKSAGFTLVESLAALAILLAGLGAIGALANSSLHATLSAEQHLAEVSAVEKILAGLPPRDALAFGRSTGEVDGFAWRADASVLPSTVSAGAGQWTPQGVTLIVRSPSGSLMEIDTIRLRRKPTR